MAQGVSLFATHIVGGMVTYRYLGNRTYELTFKVYRDCDPNVQTGFDGDLNSPNPNIKPFAYTVFDNATGDSVRTGQLFLITKNKVSSAITNECLDTSLSCVEEATYRDTIQVPSDTKWYSIYHERCCRNNGINNLKPNPGGGGGGSSFPGMTIYTTLPPSITYGNNSAVFKNYPPLFLCRNQQFNFDHSATDADGDQLNYFIVNPLEGGTATDPQPDLANFTKTNVTWQPPYSLSNIMGGNINAAIDVNTGFFTCKPDVSGRFVVSIMVKEFRGGICIDSAIRDFQFNVNDCDIPKSDLNIIPGTYDPATKLFDHIVNCKNKKVDFINSSTNANNFFWRFGDPSTGVLDTSTLSNPTHIYSDTGTFIITLISYKTRLDNKICKDSIRARVLVYPTFTSNFTFPTTPPICSGKDVLFSDLSFGTYGTVNKWTWDFGDGMTDNNQNPSHKFATSGTFNVKLRVENTKKCTADTTIPLFVNYSPTISATLPNACIGQPFNPVCAISVPSPDNIVSQRWTLPDKTVTTCSTTYTPPNMTPFKVNLWAITNKGCIDSSDFTINVNPLPRITAISDMFICYDATATLDVNGGISYLWSPAAELDNPTSKTPIASPKYPTASLYKVKGTDALGCYNFDSVLVDFYVKPPISAGKDTNICLNPGPFKRETVQLNGTGNFTTFYWTPTTGLDNPNSKTPIAKPTATTDYIFNGIDINNCIVKDTVRVIVLDPSLNLFKRNDTLKCSYDTIKLEPLDLGSITRYVWSPTKWIYPGDELIRTPRIYNRDTMTYTLTVQNYCYQKSENIIIYVKPNPITYLPLKDSTCYGTIYQFNLNPVNTYVWSTLDPSINNKGVSNPQVNPKSDVWYYVTATNNFNCTIAEAMEMIVNYPPNVNVLGLPKFVCLGDSVKMKVITNISKAKVKWFDATYVSDSTSRDILYYPQNSATLNVKVSSAENCFTLKSYNIPVQKPIIPNVANPVHMCKGSYTQLYASGGFYYLWKPYYNLNDSFSDKPQVAPDSHFTYIVKISNDCFDDTVSVSVIVDTLPIVKKTVDTFIYRGTDIELSAQTPLSRIEWTPHNKINTNPYSHSIRVGPMDKTKYFIKVIDGNECIGIDSIQLDVLSKNVLLIPTGFSPNGDGVNDIFKIEKHLNIKQLDYLEVYNRWGQKMFSTTKLDQGWDGTFNGDPCPTGSYTWQIQVTNYDNEKISKSGSLEVIR